MDILKTTAPTISCGLAVMLKLNHLMYFIYQGDEVGERHLDVHLTDITALFCGTSILVVALH